MSDDEQIWRDFDHALFGLKIRADIRQLRERTDKEQRRIRHEFHQNGDVNYLSLEYRLQDCDVETIADWAKMYDRVSREVLSVHGKVVTPAFIRMVFRRVILPLLAIREGTIETEFKFKVVRTNLRDSISTPVIKRLHNKVRELREELWEKYEIEAKTLAIQFALLRPNAAGLSSGPQPQIPPKPLESINQIRAKTVAKVIEELNILKPLMFGTRDYLDLRPQFGAFITFEMADKHPTLKDKLLHIQDHSRRHYRFAQEIAAAYHGRTLSTIQTDWKRFKPAEFKDISGRTNTRSYAR